MRLTADLIHNSLSYLNPLKERELDLRGHKIPTIENLAVAGPHDAIDFTDNALTTLSNFPFSPRLHTLLLARNRIASISPTLATTLPHLTTLVLTANNLAQLADLDPLQQCTRLTHLTCADNPVARHEHYRSWVIWRCPRVRFLDYRKVKDVERARAKELFGESADAPTALASKIMGIKSHTFDVGANDTNGVAFESGVVAAGGGGLRVKLTDKEKAAVKELIRNAKSLQEIARLEKDLHEGRVPAELLRGTAAAR